MVSLGLALALNTTMFALADAVLHPYVPYPHPEQIVLPFFTGGDPKHVIPPDARYSAIRDGLHSYDRIAAYTTLGTVMVHAGAISEYRTVLGISNNFFDLLGVRPMYGRVFDVLDSTESAQVAVISFTLWTRFYNRRPLQDVLTLEVGRTRYTVVGIMPRGVHAPWDGTDIWLPTTALPGERSSRVYGPIAIVRLKAGITADAAKAQLMSAAARLTAEYTPKKPVYARVFVERPGFSSPIAFPQFLVGTVVMVLIIACANLGTMMVARGLARRRETAIRIALGAARRDIIRGVLCECGIIGAAGVTLGVLLTWWALYVLPHFTVPWVPQLGDLLPVISWRVFTFALGASLATILAAGALPAWRGASTDPAEPMKESSATTTGSLRDHYNPLIVLEVALSTALLMCSALFVIVVIRLAAFDFRYAAKRLVQADVAPGIKLVPQGSESKFYNDLILRAAHVPHASSAATMRWATPANKMIMAEQGKSGDTWMNSNAYMIVSPQYFGTMGIPIDRGRDFAAGDVTAKQPVAIVDEAAAGRLWPDIGDPVGRMLKLGSKESTGAWIRVVGVVQAIEYTPRKDIDLPPDPIVYVVIPNDSGRAQQLIVRGDGDGGDRGRAALAIAVQQMIRDQLPSQGDVAVRPWLDDYERSRDSMAFLASLFGAFAGFGLVLCAVGLYGVLAYTVTRRLRELAVRIALGARRRDVVRLVVHDAAVMALAGIGIGAFIALWFTGPIMDGLGTSTISYAPVVALVASESLLFAGAFVASLGPVRRAAQADPLEIIRAI